MVPPVCLPAQSGSEATSNLKDCYHWKFKQQVKELGASQREEELVVVLVLQCVAVWPSLRVAWASARCLAGGLKM